MPKLNQPIFERDRGLSKSVKWGTIILYCYTLFSYMITASAIDTNTIRANQSIRDGNTIVSANGLFELGFFSPGSSTKRYLGIWYKMSHTTVVWVANRETPLTNTSGVVVVGNKGSIVLTSDGESGNKIIWSSKSSRFVSNPIVQLLDSGNLVLRDGNDRDPKNFIWQSFDYPVDTELPGMKFGVDLVTGLDRHLTPWKSVDDPSPGNFTHLLDPNGFPQLLLWKGSVLWYRSGPWVGLWFSGNSKTKMFGIYIDEFVLNEREIYYRYELADDNSPISRYAMNPSGDSEIMIWSHRNQDWIVYITLHTGECDRYGLCGSYGSCNANKYPRCQCLKGFVPKFKEKWEAADWSDGCIRKKQLSCENGDRFMKYSGVKLPDTRMSWYNMSMNLKECMSMCFKNCSCTAYTNADIREGGSGCILWFGELMDIKYYTDGEDIYVRMSSSEFEDKRSRGKSAIQTLVFTIMAGVLLSLILYLLKKRIQKRRGRLRFNSEMVALNKIEGEDFELPLFGFIEIANATNNFSCDNKLGEGGFGPVYKGLLVNKEEIAAKRLAKDSRQGVDEFMNEVSCIAKLQHRNLVTILGCCIEKGERMLIYEYLPNKSLDIWIFDEEVRKSLDWSKRYNIINGIARGLLYLHQDSKLRIIHRDLKTSNILLDYEMNPKISDFGMARCFGGNETEANTKRVVGTYGYMPPEYAIDGIFSAKSDVYSFGVILIEIISGNKNRAFIHPDHSLNLLGHAYRSYKEDKLPGLVDVTILESCNHPEVFRVIQIGLLCVQQHPADRPSMSNVVLMLSSNIALPHPKHPGFFTERTFEDPHSSSNQLTMTVLEPR